MAEYVPILVFLFVAIVLPLVLIGVAALIRPHRPDPVKLSPYECGIEPETDARGRQSVHYYIIAVLFVIFDVETVFLFPWAVALGNIGIFGKLRPNLRHTPAHMNGVGLPGIRKAESGHRVDIDAFFRVQLDRHGVE